MTKRLTGKEIIELIKEQGEDKFYVIQIPIKAFDFNGKQYKVILEKEEGSCNGCAFYDFTNCPDDIFDCEKFSTIALEK